MSIESINEEFLPKFLEIGPDKFFRFLIIYALNKLIYIAKDKNKYKGVSPEIEFINYYDQFIILYRRNGEQHHLDLARIFRRAGHKIYWTMLRKEMINRNDKFLNLVN